MKRLLVTGCYNPGYPRNHALLKALAENFQVTEVCLSENHKCPNWSLFTRIWKSRNGIDSIFFVWPIHKCLAAICLTGLLVRKKIILDLFWSPYETYVLDRGLAGKRSLKAAWYLLQDILACLSGKVLIFDTVGRERYFRRRIPFLKNKKTAVVPVTVDTARIKTAPTAPRTSEGIIDILFYGLYIPLQGVEYIIQAASLLKEDPRFEFTLIGSGQTKDGIVATASAQALANVRFVDRMPYEQLIARIKAADICLGIFGKSEKASRVIPNKVLDCMACGKLVITGYNPDLAGFFTDKKELLYCRMADAQDLAKTILYAADNPGLVEPVGQAAQSAVERDFSIRAVSDKIAGLDL